MSARESPSPRARAILASGPVVLLTIFMFLSRSSAVAASQVPTPLISTAPSRGVTASPQGSAIAVGGRKERFEDKLILVLLDDKTHPSLRGGRSLWAVEEQLRYRAGSGDELITVPAGFVTDLASIPRWAWTLLPPDGPWVKAAVVHDFLYDTNGDGIWKHHSPGITRAKPYTRSDADAVLREAMADRGVDMTRRNIIWAAVRLGGGGGWASAGERHRLRDAESQP